MERSNKMRSSSSETSSVNGPSGGSQSRRPFIPAGVVTYAAIVEKSPIPIPEGRKASFTRAQKEGLRYEARVHEYLKRLVESEGEKRYKYLQSPWIMFRSEFDPPRRMRYCQPDALLVPLALHEPKKHTPSL